MSTTYQIGQEVTALTSEQGLTEGATYQVVHVISEHTPWGSYTDYILAGGDMSNGLLQIRNGHIVLRAA